MVCKIGAPQLRNMDGSLWTQTIIIATVISYALPCYIQGIRTGSGGLFFPTMRDGVCEQEVQ